MNPFEKYISIHRRAVQDYEKKHPHWRIEVLVSLIKWSLESLKHYIEDAQDSQITWETGTPPARDLWPRAQRVGQTTG